MTETADAERTAAVADPPSRGHALRVLALGSLGVFVVFLGKVH